MFKETIKEIKWGAGTLTLKTGKIARQSDGAVIASMGDTVVLCTTVSAKKVKEDATFFPLTVHYREMAFAAGKIPGGFMKREGKASDREVLVSRLIDRPIRPLFHPAFFNETQVICTVLSHDPKYCSDVIAMIGASAALAISGVPYMHVIAAAKVGFIDGEYILNPSAEELSTSKLDLVVAGTDTSVMMVESEAKELSEEQMLGAVEFGHKSMQPVIALIEELKKEAGKPAWPLPDLGIDGLIKELISLYSSDIEDAFTITDKLMRYGKLDMLFTDAKEKFLEEYGQLKLDIAFEEVKSKVVRQKILHKKIRIDGRKPENIRPIECETGLLPRVHGSALFTRGETQGLVAATLGTGQDEQIVESLDGEGRDRFLLHYIFPPYSVGESSPFRAPGRREIGHGKLAWRAINPILPSKEEFPYTLRVVSEITESNGSSSMATVCGASMSLMDAGVPLKAPVAGIAMGLIKENKDYVVLSDIMGDEDHLGDMDFKVAGTQAGVTALQMDIKVTGINYEIMKIALSQAKDGRFHILHKMNEAISEHKSKLSDYAPQIVTIQVEKDKIREIIGPGGKVIKEICEISGAKIDISDDGIVKVSAVGQDKIDIALNRIKEITYDPQVGDVVSGTIVKILDSGAFVNIPGGKDGYLHISEISTDRVESVDSVLSVGQQMDVKIIDFDRGKIKVSIKALLKNDGEVKKSPKQAETSDDDDPNEPNGNRVDSDRPRREKSDRAPSSKPRRPSDRGDRPARTGDRPARSGDRGDRSSDRRSSGRRSPNSDFQPRGNEIREKKFFN
jgi:polyribonucleotide nucleotidyltransferase